MPEHEIAQRPCGNGQNRAEQDCGGEGSQHRQNSDKQTREEQEQNDSLKELPGASRRGGMHLVSRGGNSGGNSSAIAIDHLPMSPQQRGNAHKIEIIASP